MIDLISIDVDKEPYIKIITQDKIINLTGQSGSGKSTYARKFLNDDNYIIIDTDILMRNNYSDNEECMKLREYLKNKYRNKLLDLGKDFDLIYVETLNYFKNIDKTIVIDCAQFHCIKDISLLKGKVIIMRTSINTCYKRCIERYIKRNPGYTEQELEEYKKRKKKIYEWYHGSNEFLKKIDSL